MMKVLLAAACVALALTGAVLTGPSALAQEVERAPAPAWVQPLSQTRASGGVNDAPSRLLAFDEQVRIDAEGVHNYYFRRLRIQSRQGLADVGTITAVWSPPRETLQVHAVRIIRGDQVIDALEGETFHILRRENNLEASMLDGRLTASLQPRDLRVGDILETEFTIHDSGGVLTPHRENVSSIGVASPIDHYRLRATWPQNLPLRVQATQPWSGVQPRRMNDDWVFEIEATDLPSVPMPDDLPGRFYLLRMAQFTDFTDWADASRLMAPLYERGAALEADSPLRAEIERIRAAHDTDAARAAAALRLVQDQVRYVALSMGEGGYVPVPADEVWRSRYGDCKGKTVLLLALLHGLGIQAEAAAVSMGNGDGMNERLPLVAWFDHVIVRAVIDGQAYWMDGTSTGDHSLEGLVPPPYRWALPIRAEGSGLIPIEQVPAALPTFDIISDIDASEGLDAEARLIVDIAYRGSAAIQMREQVAAIPPDQLQTLMDQAVNDESGLTRMESFDTRYDEADNAFHMIFRGRARMSWVNSSGGRVLTLTEGGLQIPYQDEREGLYAPFKDLPYVVSHPVLVRVVTRVTLPGGGEGFQLEGGDHTIDAGGHRIERRARLNQGVAEVVVTTASLTHEISAAEMAAARTQAEGLVDTGVRVRAPASYVATEADRARLEPGDDPAGELVRRANGLRATGDAEGALSLLDAALAQEPDNGEALRARGGAYLDARNYAAAAADYDRAVDLDPADVEALIGQGRVAMSDGRFNDAVVSFSVALRLDPGQATALLGRGRSYYQIGRADRALADFRALKNDPANFSRGLQGELRSLTRLGRTDEARALITTRLETDPNDLVALEALVRTSWLSGQPAEALPALDAAVAGAPQNYMLLLMRGEARARAGQAEGARQDFDALRRLSSGDPLLMNAVCWSQAITGFDLEQALADCDQAVASGEAATIDSRAMVLLQMDRYAEARAAYDEALAGAPHQAASLYGRGLARLALGDEGGREDLVSARARDIEADEDFAVFQARRPELRR